MKNCKTCGVELTEENAYRYSNRKGLMNECKLCFVKRNKENRQNHKEYYREYYKKYYHLRPTEKKKAWAKLREAIDRGDIVKKPCAICGNKDNLEAHHFDYNKPLEVIWFCKKHHRETHKKLIK